MSAIVCTRNRPDLIGDCLDALSANAYPDLRILVVDQSSDTSTADMVGKAAARDARMSYVRDGSVGVSHARNLAIRESDGDVLVFTDDDCVPEPDWIEAVATEFAADSGVSAVYGRSLPHGNPMPGERMVAVKSSPYRRVFLGKHNPWFVGHGNNMAFRRDVFARVGLFDEMMGPGAVLRNCDDADFTYRVLRAGLRAVYSPTPVVYHKQFRMGEDLWRLEKDYSVGAGALYSKQIKMHDFYVLRLMLDRWSRCGALHVAYGLATWRKNHIRLGWYRIAYSLLGMSLGRRYDVDPAKGVFTELRSELK